MPSYNVMDRSGHKSSASISEHIIRSLNLSAGEYSRDELIKKLKAEKEILSREFTAWQKSLEKLDAIPSVSYYRSYGLIKLFDVEKRIETDTDKARVNTYIIKGPNVEKLLSTRKVGKKAMIVKFISPRTMELIVSVWLFYEKALELFDKSIEFLNKCEDVVKIES